MGFAGLNHILQTDPDGIKVDGALVTDVHNNPAKRAMISALVSFADNTGIEFIAEGIEDADEADMVRHLGIPLGQGYHLARPAPLATIEAMDRPRGVRQGPASTPSPQHHDPQSP